MTVVTLLALRLGRWGIAGFGLIAFAISLLQTAGFYQVAVRTEAERRVFGRSVSILAEHFAGIVAGPTRPHTVGGPVQWGGFWFLVNLFFIFGPGAAGCA